MFFQVNFKLPNNNCMHVRGLTSELGTDLLQLIRQEIGARVPARQLSVKHYCPSFNQSTYALHLTEEQLQQVEHLDIFSAREIINVIVPDGFLGQYWNMEITRGIVSSDYTFIQSMLKSRRMTSTYEIEYGLDSDQLFKDWISAGCPEKWDDKNRIKIDDIDPDYRHCTISRNSQSGAIKYFEDRSNLIGDNIQDVVLANEYFTKDHSHQRTCAIFRIADVPAIINILVEKLSPKGVRQLITLCESRLKELERNSDEE